MIWKAATSESGSLGHLMLVWLALTTTLVFGFLTVRASAPAGAQFRVIGVDLLEVVPPRSGAGLGELRPGPIRPSEVGLDRTDLPLRQPVLYAGLQWTLHEARFVSADARPDRRPVVIVELDVLNTVVDQTLRVRASDMMIHWHDGRTFPVDRLDRVESSRSFSIEPGRMRSVTAVFKPSILTDPVLEETVLQIGDPGRVPILLPLAGPAPAVVDQVIGSVADEPVTIADPEAADRPNRAAAADSGAGRSPGVNPVDSIVITPQQARLALNAGPYRAAIGSRLVLVDVAVERPDIDRRDRDRFPRAEHWRLVADGTNISPSQIFPAPHDPEADPGPDRVTLVFIVERGVEQMQLELLGTDADPTPSWTVQLAEDGLTN